MTPQQLTTLKAAILADANPAVVAALAIRNDTELARLYNLPAAPAVAAWLKAATGQQIFEATNITQFDSVSAGKRDVWKLLIERADLRPIDFGRNQIRNAVIDVWSAQTLTQRNAICNGLTESATVAEVALGGTVRFSETNGVSALDRNFAGQVTIDDIGSALNG
jgi:hypothetical protein